MGAMWRSGARRCLPKEQGICVPGTKGAEIVDELTPLPNETILRKLRFSAFFQTELDMILRRLKIDTLLIAGTQYPNCVRGPPRMR